MHTCEIFSIKKNKADFESFSAEFGRVKDSLTEQGIEVRSKIDISADPKKLSAAVTASLNSDPAQMYIFANALNTSDSSSFKNLFYELIAKLESELIPDEDHPRAVPKLKVFSLGDLGCGYKGYCFRCNGRVFIAVPYASLTELDIAELLSCAIAKTSDVLTAKRDEYPGGVTYLTAEAAPASTKKKENFFLSFIPHKGDKRGDVLRKVIVLIAIIAFITAACYLVNQLWQDFQNKSDTDEIQSIAHRDTRDATDDEAATTADGEKLPEEDWAALKKINKEIVGWITLKGTPINYPVLWHKGDDESYQYYLSHSYKNEYSDYGSIFLDYRSKQGTDSKNVILHGHNMLNGSMFHEITNYASGYSFNADLNYYKKHSVITFNTPDGDAKWKVISVFKTSTLFEHGEFFNYMQGEFNSDAEFMNFVYNVRIRSMFNIPVTVNKDDQLLTLSTCSYEFKNFRTVVVARKVRPGEDETVDVKKATVNDYPLYPEVYYDSYGGSRPDVLTFKTAYAYGEINWYDGLEDPQKLEGSEDLTDTIAANELRMTDSEGNPIAGYTYYYVTYRNLDDSQIAAYTVRKGTPVPVPDIIPTYEDDYFIYTFVEWNRDIDGVNFDALNTSITLYPIYSHERKPS